MSTKSISPCAAHIEAEPATGADPLQKRTPTALRELPGTVAYYGLLGIGVFTPCAFALHGCLFR